jgi:hypothetical protein
MSQHDMVIDNGPGLAVRTDMNAAIQALASSNAGPVEPTVSYPGQLWLDTTITPNGQLRQRNQANNGWVAPLMGEPYAFAPADMSMLSRTNAPGARIAWNSKADGTGTDLMSLQKAGTLTVAGAITGTGAITGGSFSTTGTVTAVGVTTTTGNVTAGSGLFASPTASAVLATTGAGNVYLRPNGGGSGTGQTYVASNGQLTVAGPFICSGSIYSQNSGYTCKAGMAGTTRPNVFNWDWAGGAVIYFYADNTLIGSLTTSSDYRIKKDVADLGSRWETVKTLRPIKYTQAAYTPQSEMDAGRDPNDPFIKSDDIERWGFIAHELQAAMIPSAASGEKDTPDEIQSPNPWTLLAALTSALQEAMTRIEALEGAAAA